MKMNNFTSGTVLVLENQHQNYLNDNCIGLRYTHGSYDPNIKKAVFSTTWKETSYTSDDYTEDINSIQIAPNQVILEYDVDNNKELADKFIIDTCKKLEQDNIGYELYDHQGRSMHIHLQADATLTREQKQDITKKYSVDDSIDLHNCDDVRLIACPFAQHYKTKKVKQFIKRFHGNLIKVADLPNAIINNNKETNGPLDSKVKLVVELISPHWKLGNREDLALHLSSYLRKNKMGLQNIKKIITLICKANNDPEIRMRVGAVNSSFEKDEDKTAGYSRLKELLPQDVLDKLSKEFKNEFPSIFEEEDNITETVFSLLLNDKRNEAIELVVNELYQKHKFYSIRDDKTEEIWMYNNGIYVPFGKSYIAEFVRNILKERYTSQFSNQVIDRIRVDNFIEKEIFFENNYPNEMALENGVLNVYTRKLTDHDPNKIFLSKLLINYDPNATCPKIEKFFCDVLNESDRTLMYEFIGDCLQKTYKYKKIIVQEGDQDTAKTTTQGLLSRFFGNKNISSLSLNRLISDNFSLGELHNKFLNTSGEITIAFISNISLLKCLTGEDWLNIRRKFLTDLKFLNHAKLIFACNELPRLETDLAMWNRFILFRYGTTFIDENEWNNLPEVERANKKIKNINILDEICIEEEFSGLLNKALDGLDRIRKDGYSTNKTGEDNRIYWIRKSDSFRAFCLDNIESSETEMISRAELKKVYYKYCVDHRLKKLTDKSIKDTLYNEFSIIARNITNPENEKQEFCYEGIRLKEERQRKLI